MKTSSLVGAFLVLANLNIQAQVAPTPVPDATLYQVVERGENHRVWQKTVLERGSNGKLTTVIHKYTELKAGLYFKNPQGEWVESKAIINPLSQGGAAATEGVYKAYFPEDIYEGYIKVVVVDNQIFKSRPVALSYDDGNSIVMLAQLTNSMGQMLGDNQVIYTNAFVGIGADIVFTYHLGSFEQDIILRERPPTPESLGLNPATARLQVLTEFFDPPAPMVTPLTLPNQSGVALADQFLDFGKASMVPGRAFLINSGTNTSTGKVSVGKQWLNLDGRQILVEEVPIAAVADQIATLTASFKIGKTNYQTMASTRRQLPPPHLAKSGGSGRPMLMAAAMYPSLGLVLDYNIVLDNKVDFTFQGDTTYYIKGDNWFDGTTTIEGGAVIKHESTNSGNTMVRGPLVCKTTPYHPAIITLSDDDTVGEVLPGSTGNPVKQTVWMAERSTALFSWYGGMKLHDLMIRYLGSGVVIQTLTTNRDNEIKNCQFESVFTPIGTFRTNNLNLQNVLINDANVCFMIGSGGTFIVENSTIHNINLLFWQPGETPIMAFTNCLFIGVTNCLDPDPANYWRVNYPTPFDGYNCVTNLSDAGVFQTVGAGHHYLATNSPYRNAGTTGISPFLLAELRQKTTIPPVLYSNTTFTTATVFSPQVQTDTNSNPDLGYHYDPVDYLVSSCTVSNATLTVTNGAIVASYGQHGLQLLNGSQLVSIGSPLVPNMFVRGASVQERPSPTTNGITADVTGTVNAVFRFTKFTCPANSGYDLYHVAGSTFSSLDVQNCEFWGGANDLSGSTNTTTATIKNNLFWRSSLFASNTSAQASLFLTNNTFWGTTVTLKQPNSGLWSAFNNDFDSCSVSGTLTNGYNAYLKTSGRLSPTNSHDYISTGTLAYQSGPLGDFYQSPIGPLINAGNASASLLGLYQFTTQTNQAKDGSTMVDIGYHYVALDTNGYPLASSGDGIPDYIEDPAGITNCSSAPWITTLPISQSAIVGDDIVFTVAAAGVPTPGYQWYFNGTAIGGATNATLTLNNVQTNDIGSYAVVVSNPFGWQTCQVTLSVSAVWNYVDFSGALTNFVFQGDTTYYVNSTVQLYGTTTIEGGTVIKYGNNIAAKLVLNGPIKCLTAPYRPAILTSRDENMMGVSIHQSTGLPTNNCATYIVSTAGQTNDLKYLHIKYAGTGILASNTVEVWNSQFVQCGTAVSSTNGGTIALHNILIAQSTNCVSTSGDVKAEFLTADQCAAFCPITYVGASLTNSLLTAVANTGGVSLVASESLSSSAGLYQVVGGGSYYLATNSPYRNAGTTNITTAMFRDLKTKTTYPPIIYGTTNIYWGTSLNLYPQAQRDTNATDIGYHYEALDYIFGSMYVTNANITLNPGTAAGIYSLNYYNYGLNIAMDASFTSKGTANNKVHIAQYLAVQDKVASGWSKTWYNCISGNKDLTSEYTEWSSLAHDTYLMYFYGSGVNFFKNCELYGGQIYSYSTVNFTNCLIGRVDAYLEYDNNDVASFCNNLVYGGNFYYYPWTVTNSVVRDNLFDNVNIDSWFGGDDGTLFVGGHNAYVTNCTRLIIAKPGDITLPASPAYQAGPLGYYYLPADSPLINAGSTNADQIGLFHYTTQTNQTKETNSIVDIGYHYVAVDGNGNSMDLNGNGIPDYLEDANGNGLVDNGEANWDLAILSQPQSQTILTGANAIFTVTASGAAPIKYQWYFNTNTLLANATNATLVLANVQMTNAGSYKVVITNAAGSITSSVATLVVMFSPISVSGLTLWLKADAGVALGSSNQIAVWMDQSGHTNDATQVNDYDRPLYITNAVNGLPSVWFSGTNSSVWTNSYFNLPNTLLNGATGAEAFVVVRTAENRPSAHHSLWEMGGDPQPYKMFPDTDGSIKDDFGSGSLHTVGTPAAPLNEFNVYQVSSHTNDWAAWFNGVLLYQTNVNTVQFPTQIVWPYFGYYTLGGSPFYGTDGLPNFFAGEIAEVLVFNCALTTNDRAALNIYLNGKYGLVPQVAITSPTNYAVFATGSNIVISASASEPGGGTIKQVEFFQGSTSLGVRTTAPYSIIWSNSAAGIPTTNFYSLTAVAIGNNGLAATSSVVTIRIDPPLPPQVNLITPTNNSLFVTGSNISLTATASEQSFSLVRQVEFFQGTTSLGVCYNSPYAITWSNVAAGASITNIYALTARATGSCGLVSTSSVVNIQVDPPPAVSITSPANNAYLVGIAPYSLTITASASDVVGVKQVQFFQGSNSMGILTNPPYSFVWNIATAGNYVLTAVATGNDGFSTTSINVNVTFDADSKGDGLGDSQIALYGINPNETVGFWILVNAPNGLTEIP